VLTVAAVAEAKGIKAQSIEARVKRETAEDTVWKTRFTIELYLGSGLTSRERTILFNSARCCEVHRLLTGDLQFDYRMLAPEP
jgi:uncharacterized OsmC-like protein